MNTFVVLSAIVVSCLAGGDYYPKGHTPWYGRGGIRGGGGIMGGGGMNGGMMGGGGMNGGMMGGGGMNGGIMGGGGMNGGMMGGGGMNGGMMGGGGMNGGMMGGGGIGGNIGGLTLYRAPKYGSCSYRNMFDRLQMGAYCYHDDNCPGSQKCCYSFIYGRRCQIPQEYQRFGSCNYNYITFPTRRACNDDTICPYGGKCCRREVSGQVDTCTYPFSIYPLPGNPGTPYPIPGNPGTPYPIPGNPGTPYPGGHKHKKVY
ncbi:aspartate, glycine, lysine and serine-rich protein-like [Ostrea edulis]|uniref:aspartate, glycine, lysine and serine-rich protein-like n=1 Tax=Ostrea edulis TaxID=37623 RepID=UPI0024AEA874|nr:aspartate, glycine, lysine and serine-rich protein-like [Ostrea edulis]